MFLDFFKKKSVNIFIEGAPDSKKLSIGSGNVDYILSRSLYASIPTSDVSYADYELGNYSIKTYIDTFSSFISTPKIVSSNDELSLSINNFIKRNKAVLLKIYRQAMIDGLCYIWVRLEKNTMGFNKPVIKIISREHLKKGESIKRRDGSFEAVTFEFEERWVIDGKDAEEEKSSTVKVTLKAFSETWEVLGELPPGYQKKKEEWNTGLSFIPIFAFYNNKLEFLSDGLPEVTSLLPFIRKYNIIFQKLDRHLNNILDPKLKLHLKSAQAFLKNTMGIREGDYKAIERGDYKPDITQFKVAILQDKEEDATFLTQENNVQSAINVLSLLHWIIIELTMPEYLYGTALNTTNASVKEQSPVWLKKIEDRRSEYSNFYYWLSEVFLAYSNIINGRDMFIEHIGEESWEVAWEEVEAQDDIAIMTALKAFTDSIISLMDEGIIGAETAFNTLKNFITIPNDFDAEHKLAIAHIKEKMELENERNASLNGLRY